MSALKLFPSSSFSDDDNDDFDFDSLEAAAPAKDSASLVTACSLAEVAKVSLVVARLENPQGITSKKTAGFHKTVDPDKLRAVARSLFN